MTQHFKRAVELYDMEKWENALREFTEHLKEYPEDSQALSLSAFCLLKLKFYPDALETAGRAVAADPTDPQAHYTLSLIYRARHELEPSYESIRQALELAPGEAHYWSALGELQLMEAKWVEALDSADEALQNKPEDLGAINVRATALIKLRRVGEARDTLMAALSNSPEDSQTLANLGWLELERSQPQEALKFFEQALASDPESEWAREGLMHALRSRFPLYGLVLRYFLFMSKYSAAIQRQIMFAAFVGRRLIDYLLEKYPRLAALVAPLMVLWHLFSYLTWTIRAATTLLLRGSKYGRMLVRDDEIVESNIVAALWGSALVTWLYHYFVDPFALFPKIAPYVFLSMPMLIASCFDFPKGTVRKVAYGATAFLSGSALVGLIALVLGNLELAVSGLKIYFLGLGPVLLIFGVLPKRQDEERAAD